MRYKDLSVLEVILNKRRKFSVNYISHNYTDIFYGEVKEIHQNHIIVQQEYIKADENYNEEYIIQKRKLDNGLFDILKD